MYRGTTPTLTFTLPFPSSKLTLCNVAFAQEGNVVLEKDLSDCQIGENTLTVQLSEEETLQLESEKPRRRNTA